MLYTKVPIYIACRNGFSKELCINIRTSDRLWRNCIAVLAQNFTRRKLSTPRLITIYYSEELPKKTNNIP